MALFSQAFKKNLLAHVPALTVGLYGLALTIGLPSGGAWALIGIGGAFLLAGSVWLGDGGVPKPDGPVSSLGGCLFILLFFNKFFVDKSG